MKRTVLHYTDTVGFGGAEQIICTLIDHLDHSEWEPVLVHHPEPGIAPLLDHMRRSGVETWQVPRMRAGRGAHHWPAFVRSLRARRPSAFHAHLTMPLACKPALAAAAVARIPAVIATEQLFVDIPYRYSRLVERLVAPGIDRYLAVSEHLARQLAAALPFVRSKLQVVHNAIPLEQFENARSSGLAERLPRPIILTVARLTEQKGLDDLLEAAAQVPNATFVIAGSGPEASTLAERTAQLGLSERVLWLGQADNIPELLHDCDLFVLPSRYEGLPVSVLEAMAAGQPVIATRVGGTPEAVCDGVTGLLVPPRDPTALARAITTLLGSPDYARRLGQAGRKRVRAEFSAERMAQRTMEIYRQVLTSKGLA